MEEDAALESSHWSSLHIDIADQILSRLPLPDFLRFGSVCKPWRSIVLAQRRRRPPMLVNAPCRPAGILLSYFIDDGRRRRFKKLPMTLPFSPSENPQFISGLSFHGWVLVKSSADAYYMLNPISNHRIHLPPNLTSIYHLVLSSPPDSQDCMLFVYGTFSQGTVHDHDVQMTVNQRTDYTLAQWIEYGAQECFGQGIDHSAELITFSQKIGHAQMVTFYPWTRRQETDHVQLASCKLADWEWIMFDEPAPESILSMAFHKGKLYVLLGDLSTKIYVCDSRSRMVGSMDPISFLGCTCLVESADSLLMVAIRVKACHVFKLDDGRWVRVTSVGDQVVLLNDYGSFSFDIGEVMGSDFKRNCIYDTQMNSDYMDVYDMEDGSYEKINYPRRGTNLWLMPSQLN